MNLQAQNLTDFYMKTTIYYGQYIRNVVLPLERIKANIRNISGLKNKGERETKMLNSIMCVLNVVLSERHIIIFQLKNLHF